MGLDTVETPKANGLKTALDTIIAPKEAFETLRVAPTWGWAFALTLVLYAIGTYLLTPALVHANGKLTVSDALQNSQCPISSE